MLSRLGEQLQGAVGAEGSAYRVGGDEFAVIATCADEQRGALTKRVTEALTARGRGFELSAAWGAVSIPGEADSPLEALQLADVRMYAQKESRRLAYTEPIEPHPTEAISVRLSPRDGEALEQGQ